MVASTIASHLGAPRHVGVERHSLATVLLEHADGLGRAVVVDVDDDDARALLGHQHRRGAALARARPGDEGDLAGEEAGEVEVESGCDHCAQVATTSSVVTRVASSDSVFAITESAYSRGTPATASVTSATR